MFCSWYSNRTNGRELEVHKARFTLKCFTFILFWIGAEKSTSKMSTAHYENMPIQIY